jgi:DNA-binding protein HU-beta
MTKTQLIETLARELGLTKKLTNELVNRAIWLMIKWVRKDGEVRLTWFGTFRKFRRKARDGVNPQNPKQLISIPAMNIVKFKAGSMLKKAIK